MPSRVYALVETTDPDEGLYRSDDFGEDLGDGEQPARHHEPPVLLHRRRWPTRPTPTTSTSTTRATTSRSTQGMNFERRQTPHGDNHDTWINPENPLIQIQSKRRRRERHPRWRSDLVDPSPTSPPPSSIRSTSTISSPTGCMPASRTTRRSGFQVTHRVRVLRVAIRATGRPSVGVRPVPPFPSPGDPDDRVLELQRAVRSVQSGHRTGEAVLRRLPESLRSESGEPELPVPARRSHRGLPRTIRARSTTALSSCTRRPTRGVTWEQISTGPDGVPPRTAAGLRWPDHAGCHR